MRRERSRNIGETLIDVALEAGVSIFGEAVLRVHNIIGSLCRLPTGGRKSEDQEMAIGCSG